MFEGNETIPWWMSDVGPHRLVTSAEMTAEQLERAKRDAEIWAKEGLSTRIHCQRCGKWDSELNPECHNAKLHERYTAERKAKQEAKDELLQMR